MSGSGSTSESTSVQPSPSPSSKTSSLTDRSDAMTDEQRLEWEMENLALKPPPRLESILCNIGENIAFGRWLDGEQRGHEAYTKFYIGAERYKQLAKNGPGPQLGAARVLYESHIKQDHANHPPPQPLSAINITKEQISRIQAALAAKATPIDLFDGIQKQVLEYLSTFMPKFLNSIAYLNLELEGILLHPDKFPGFMKIAKNIYKEEYPMFYEEWESLHTALVNHAKTRQSLIPEPSLSPANISVVNTLTDPNLGFSHNRKSSQNDFVDEQLNQLQNIFNKYIKYRAEYRLDVSDQMKNELHDAMTKCRRVNRIPLDILDGCMRRACDVMRWEILPEYLRVEEMNKTRSPDDKKVRSPGNSTRTSPRVPNARRRGIHSVPTPTAAVPFTIQEKSPNKIKNRSSYSPKALQRLLAQASQAQAAKELEKKQAEALAAAQAAQAAQAVQASSNTNGIKDPLTPPSSLPILPVTHPVGTSINRFRSVKVDVPSSARRHSIALSDLVVINRARDQQRSTIAAFEQQKQAVAASNTPMSQQLQAIDAAATAAAAGVLTPLTSPMKSSSPPPLPNSPKSPSHQSSKSTFVTPSSPASAAMSAHHTSSSAASAALNLSSFQTGALAQPTPLAAPTASTPKSTQVRSNVQASPGLGGTIALAPAALSLGHAHAHSHSHHSNPSSAHSSTNTSPQTSRPGTPKGGPATPTSVLQTMSQPSSPKSGIICPVPAHPSSHLSGSSHPTPSPTATPPPPPVNVPSPHVKERHPNPRPPGPISINHKTPYPRHARVRRSSTSMDSQASESSDDSNLDLYSTPSSHQRNVSNSGGDRSPISNHRVTHSEDMFPFDYSSSRAFGYSADDLELIPRRPYLKNLQYALFFPANPAIIQGLRRRSILTDDTDDGSDTVGPLSSISESPTIAPARRHHHGDRSVRFSFDITEILESGTTPKKKKNSLSQENVKSCLKKKVRKETYEEVITRVFQERQRESAMLLQVMLHGTTLTKFNSLGKPAERWFTVSADGSELSWSKVDAKKGKAKSGLFSRKKSKMLADCLRMRYGSRNSRRFAKYNDDGNPPWLAFSIFFPDRSLDIVCTSDQQVTTWFLGLQSLAPLSSSYLTLGGLLWARASMKAKYFARRNKQSDAEYIDALLQKAREDFALESGPVSARSVNGATSPHPH